MTRKEQLKDLSKRIQDATMDLNQAINAYQYEYAGNLKRYIAELKKEEEYYLTNDEEDEQSKEVN